MVVNVVITVCADGVSVGLNVGMPWGDDEGSGVIITGFIVGEPDGFAVVGVA